jgi:hypothetical protein
MSTIRQDTFLEYVRRAAGVCSGRGSGRVSVGYMDASSHGTLRRPYIHTLHIAMIDEKATNKQMYDLCSSMQAEDAN